MGKKSYFKCIQKILITSQIDVRVIASAKMTCFNKTLKLLLSIAILFAMTFQEACASWYLDHEYRDGCPTCPPGRVCATHYTMDGPVYTCDLIPEPPKEKCDPPCPPGTYCASHYVNINGIGGPVFAGYGFAGLNPLTYEKKK